MIIVDNNLCKRCDICIEFCPKNTLEKNDEGFPTTRDPDSCNQCYFCDLHCPENAIQVEEGNKR